MSDSAHRQSPGTRLASARSGLFLPFLVWPLPRTVPSANNLLARQPGTPPNCRIRLLFHSLPCNLSPCRSPGRARLSFPRSIRTRQPRRCCNPGREKAVRLPAWKATLSAGGAVRSSLAKDAEAAQQTAILLSRINHVNRTGTDGFLKALVAERQDLAGLPFAMGDACRTKGERNRQLLERCYCSASHGTTHFRKLPSR